MTTGQAYIPRKLPMRISKVGCRNYLVYIKMGPFSDQFYPASTKCRTSFKKNEHTIQMPPKAILIQ